MFWSLIKKYFIHFIKIALSYLSLELSTTSFTYLMPFSSVICMVFLYCAFL